MPERRRTVVGWKAPWRTYSNGSGRIERAHRVEDTAAHVPKRALLRHAGGDRVMAKVLTAIPTFGLDAVLVAVELVIESGALSAEHVLNVLARLRQTPVIESVQTTLVLNQAPIADPHRYDRLHGQEISHV